MTTPLVERDDAFRASGRYDLSTRPRPATAAACAAAGFDLHAFNQWWHRAEYQRFAERELAPLALAEEIERLEHLIALDRHDLANPEWREEEEASLMWRLVTYEQKLERLQRQALRLIRVEAKPGRTPNADFGRARFVDLVPLAETVTAQQARKSGERHVIRCPFHEDRRPSLVIYPPGRGWHCFTCHEGGQDAVSFVARFFACTQLEALRWVETMCDLPGVAA